MAFPLLCRRIIAAAYVMASKWDREEEWRGLLQQAAKKASKNLLDTLADIAIRDDKIVSGEGYSVALCCCPHHAATNHSPASQIQRASPLFAA
jgi:hypothetical protein